MDEGREDGKRIVPRREGRRGRRERAVAHMVTRISRNWWAVVEKRCLSLRTGMDAARKHPTVQETRRCTA